MRRREHAPWWKGSRGEWFVVGQFVLIALVAAGPRSYGAWSFRTFWTLPGSTAQGLAAAALMIAGGALMWTGFVALGPALTALPYPNGEGSLSRTGPYAVVRHPIYCGLIACGSGWALWVGSWLTFGCVALLFVLLDVKSRREERWLAARYPEYPDYQRRVRRLLPFIY